MKQNIFEPNLINNLRSAWKTTTTNELDKKERKQIIFLTQKCHEDLIKVTLVTNQSLE